MPLPSLQVLKGSECSHFFYDLQVCASLNSDDDVIYLRALFLGILQDEIQSQNGSSEQRQTQNSSCRVLQNMPSRKKWLLPCDGGNLETG